MAENPKNLRVRLPVGLHAALAEEAGGQGISLNALIVALLAGGIGWAPGTKGAKS